MPAIRARVLEAEARVVLAAPEHGLGATWLRGATELAGWKALVGVHTPSDRVYDASPLTLSIPGHTIVRTDSCFGDQAVKGIFKEARDLVVHLFSKGKALDGPVRIAVVPLDGSVVSWNSGPGGFCSLEGCFKLNPHRGEPVWTASCPVFEGCNAH